MSYPMGSSAVVVDVDDRGTAPLARLPLSDGDGGGDAAATVRSVLDDELLDQMVAKMRGEVVRLSGPGGAHTAHVAVSSPLRRRVSRWRPRRPRGMAVSRSGCVRFGASM